MTWVSGIIVRDVFEGLTFNHKHLYTLLSLICPNFIALNDFVELDI